MKSASLQKYIGKVVALDLVNGHVVTAKLESITDGHAVIKQPLEFTYAMRKPGELQVGSLPYGAPLFKVEHMEIDLTHILGAFDVPQAMEENYIRETTGIVPVQKPGLILPE